MDSSSRIASDSVFGTMSTERPDVLRPLISTDNIDGTSATHVTETSGVKAGAETPVTSNPFPAPVSEPRQNLSASTASTTSTASTQKYGPPPQRTFAEMNEDLNVSTARLIETSEALVDLQDRMVALELNNGDLRNENNRVYDEARATRSYVNILRDQLSTATRSQKKAERRYKSDIERLTAEIAEEKEAATRFHQMYHEADNVGSNLMEKTVKLQKKTKRVTKKLNKYRKAAKSATRRADKAEKKLIRAETTASMAQLMATMRQSY